MVCSNNCYTFQLVEHLKQSRPGVKTPLVKLKAFEDKALCCKHTTGVFDKNTNFKGLGKPIVH